MLLLREIVVLENELLEIELHDDLRYRLAWGGVTYQNNLIHGRNVPYEFRSVEQLRYDFERHAEKA